MPIPVPRPDETKDDFINRCMNDLDLQKEFTDSDQRLAVCESQNDKSDRQSQGIKHIRKALNK